VAAGTFPLGLTEIVYTATDASGNVSTCEFSVEVRDVSAPQLICPSDITLSTAPRWCFANLMYNVTAVDNCSGVVIPTRIAGPMSGTTLPVGITRVEYAVSDAAGNNASCGFNVEVRDTHAPEIANCPASMTVQATVSTSALCGANVNWTAPRAFEACGVLSSNQSHVSGDFFDAGTSTLVRYVFDDGRGNESTCEFSITVGACPAPLPIELVSFTARVVGENVVCNWETSMEINNDRFEIERTRAIGEPEYVGTVLSKGSGNLLQNYDLTDYSPYYATSFYRLVQYDNDGTKTVYPWQEVYLGFAKDELEITAFPIPTKNDVTVRVRGVENSATFKLYDMRGKLLMTETVKGEQEMSHRIDLSRYATGIYNLEVISQGYKPSSMRLIKTN
jgi:hypothetical protein